MKKKTMILLAMFLIIALTACSKTDISAANKEESTVIAEESSGTEDMRHSEVITEGVFQSQKNTDRDGIIEAVFTDENEEEFIVIIAKDTKLPDDLEKGKKYEIYHADMQTMSLPPTITQVFKIELLKG